MTTNQNLQKKESKKKKSLQKIKIQHPEREIN